MIANKERLVEGGRMDQRRDTLRGEKKEMYWRRKDKGFNRTGNPLDLE